MLTVQLPEDLQQRFEQNARALYGDEQESDSAKKALIEAIENWLKQHEEELYEVEQRANRAAYEQLKTSLERDHTGEWAVIAHGELQGICNTRDEALLRAVEIHDARERMLFQIGTQPQHSEIQLPFDVWLNRSADLHPTSP